MIWNTLLFLFSILFLSLALGADCSPSDFDLSCDKDYCFNNVATCTSTCPSTPVTNTPALLWNFADVGPGETLYESMNIFSGGNETTFFCGNPSDCSTTVSKVAGGGVRFNLGVDQEAYWTVPTVTMNEFLTAYSPVSTTNLQYFTVEIVFAVNAGSITNASEIQLFEWTGTNFIYEIVNDAQADGVGAFSYYNGVSTGQAAKTPYHILSTEPMGKVWRTTIAFGAAAASNIFYNGGHTLCTEFGLPCPVAVSAFGTDENLKIGVIRGSTATTNTTVDLTIYRVAMWGGGANAINTSTWPSWMNQFDSPNSEFLEHYSSECGRCGDRFCGTTDGKKTAPGPTIDPNDPIVIVIAVVAVVALVGVGAGVAKYRAGPAAIQIDMTPPDYPQFMYSGVPVTGARLTKTPKASALDPLADLILSKDLHLVQVITAFSTPQMDDVCKSLVYFFEHHRKTLHLLRTFIIRDVQRAEVQETLFRGNSPVTKMMSAYCRVIALPWLFNMVGEIVRRICISAADEGDDAESNRMEIDPNKISDADAAKVNKYSLLTDAQNLFRSVKTKIDEAPPQIRHLTYVLQHEATQRFPNARYTSVAGFIFLRFINLSLTSPEVFGIVQDPSMNARRHLILLAKIMQNLANGVEFGLKEKYMSNCNEFIRDNLDDLQQYCDSLAENFKKAAPSESVVPKNVRENSIMILYHHINNNLGKIMPPLRRTNEPLAQRLEEVLDAIQ